MASQWNGIGDRSNSLAVTLDSLAGLIAIGRGLYLYQRTNEPISSSGVRNAGLICNISIYNCMMEHLK
ncbi:hypothetical protein BRADI_3g49355v3 [Brachypodium distachyon]|uniref:Uncharacterized protein n=1 Tax=Brachypodium distachyon TaxID=15368 RepID=A0A2K2D4A4_BRADI|nr:hypothetical protein BRADI_3g49355v3 [Brachypodium distachyon]